MSLHKRPSVTKTYEKIDDNTYDNQDDSLEDREDNVDHEVTLMDNSTELNQQMPLKRPTTRGHWVGICRLRLYEKSHDVVSK